MTVGSCTIEIDHTRVMMSGTPAGQHWPMSSRYTLPSACALRDASKCTCASGVSFGYGGPKRQDPGNPRSMNQVPGDVERRLRPRLREVRGREDAEFRSLRRSRLRRRLCENAAAANVSAVTSATTNLMRPPSCPSCPSRPSCRPARILSGRAPSGACRPFRRCTRGCCRTRTPPSRSPASAGTPACT